MRHGGSPCSRPRTARLPALIADLCLELPAVGTPERVPQQSAGDSVDAVQEQRLQNLLVPFHRHAGRPVDSPAPPPCAPVPGRPGVGGLAHPGRYLVGFVVHDDRSMCTSRREFVLGQMKSLGAGGQTGGLSTPAPDRRLAVGATCVEAQIRRSRTYRHRMLSADAILWASRLSGSPQLCWRPRQRDCRR